MEIAVAFTRDILPGKMIGVQIEGKSILIANVNGQYYAIGDICLTWLQDIGRYFKRLKCTIPNGYLS